MNSPLKRIALISHDVTLQNRLQELFSGQYVLDLFPNGMALHQAMQDKTAYAAILTEDDLLGSNGIPLRRTLSKLGYDHIPFMMLLQKIGQEQRKMAMEERLAEIFEKPVDQQALRVRVPYVVEHFAEAISSSAAPEYHLPLIKRMFDVFFSGLALLMLSPLFLIIAILIRFESKGPVFYYSLRVGTGYRVFKFFKFRSMFTGADAKLKDLSHLNQYAAAKAQAQPTDDASAVREVCELCEQAGTACLSPLYTDGKVICERLHKAQQSNKADAAFIKIKNDPRITKVGNFIRNTSMDELPQLWNVFIGDMSIVGNRPLPLYEAEKITTDRYALRFMAPAGITGLWQVEKRGRGEMSEDERLSLDNDYAKNHSFWNDIRLILRTIPALFQSENV